MNKNESNADFISRVLKQNSEDSFDHLSNLIISMIDQVVLDIEVKDHLISNINSIVRNLHIPTGIDNRGS